MLLVNEDRKRLAAQHIAVMERNSAIDSKRCALTTSCRIYVSDCWGLVNQRPSAVLPPFAKSPSKLKSQITFAHITLFSSRTQEGEPEEVDIKKLPLFCVSQSIGATNMVL